ncbi:MAG: type II secretion system protein [Pseudomonadota bacterium]
MCTKRRSRGFTLIELIMFIIIVGVALAGVLTVLSHTVQHSADPIVRKQGLAIAEAILEEVMLQPFTWCDPDDAAAATATQYADCTTSENNLTAEGGEIRGTYDNVNDYNGLSTTANIVGTSGAVYTANVTVAQDALNGIAADASLLVTVSVVAAGETIQVQGYRTRHSPVILP